MWGLQGAGPGAPFWVSGGVSSLSILEGHSWGNVSGDSSGGRWAAGRTTAHTWWGQRWEGSFPRRRALPDKSTLVPFKSFLMLPAGKQNNPQHRPDNQVNDILNKV